MLPRIASVAPLLTVMGKGVLLGVVPRAPFVVAESMPELIVKATLPGLAALRVTVPVPFMIKVESA